MYKQNGIQLFMLDPITLQPNIIFFSNMMHMMANYEKRNYMIAYKQKCLGKNKMTQKQLNIIQIMKGLENNAYVDTYYIEYGGKKYTDIIKKHKIVKQIYETIQESNEEKNRKLTNEYYGIKTQKD